jgi:DNA polymerase I-like protein with 3'-5' exonuclease and polymerase domains
MNVAVLDVETSSKPIMHPWMKDAYLSTIGLWVALEDAGVYYKEWVWYHGERPDITEEDRLKITFEIQEEIDRLGPNGILVGHNIKFDINWLKWFNVDVSGVRLWDTCLVDFMLSGQDKTLTQDLSSCCERAGIPVKTDVVKTYWDAKIPTHEIPLRILLPYMKNDIDITAQLFKHQWVQLKRKQALLKLCRVRTDTLHCLSDIEINGMPFDRVAAEDHVKVFTKDLEIVEAELRTYFGRDDINLSSGIDLSASLFGGTIKRTRYVPHVYDRNVTYKEPYQYTYKTGKMKGMTVTKYRNKVLKEITCRRRKEDYEVKLKGVGFEPNPKSELKDRDGNPSGVYPTNKNVLKNLRCNSKGGTTVKLKRRVLELLLHRSKIAKFTETFEGANEDTGLFYKESLNSTGRLHPSYNQTIAATGRQTSSDPNGQNFPRSKEDEDGFTNPLKRVFVASRRNGYILVIDLSQLEWRVAAWLSQDPVAMQEIIDDVDCHLDNAIKFFGDAKFRQVAKIMTFRLLYGGSAYAFYMDPLMPDFSQKRWNDIVNQYNRKYVVLSNWQQHNITITGQNKGILESPLGRIYKIPQVEHRKHKGLMIYSETCIKNYPVQGTATGDIVPLAMRVLDKRMAAEPMKFMSSNWMGQVHDSVIFDTVRAEIKRLAMLGIQVFEDLPRIISDYWQVDFNLPLTGEAEAGPNYGDMCWSLKHTPAGEWITKGSLDYGTA